ncbi:MAG: AraC-like DNA-binding protein [Paraglaciecola sp.]
MEIISIQGALLLVSLTMLMAQLLVRQKRAVHIVFAIFCGSIAMVAAKQLGDGQFGAYQYLIGMGTCATCNGFWLVSRALFREKDAVSRRHILVATGLGLLIVAGQGLGLAQSVTQDHLALIQNSREALYEVLNLLSSCILVLSAWEACRGLGKARAEQLWQRLLFLASYCSAVLISTVLSKLSGTAEASAGLSETLAAIFAIQIMLVTQVLIYWRFHRHPRTVEDVASDELDQASSPELVNTGHLSLIIHAALIDNGAERDLAQQIREMLEQQDMYLQANLKVADLARKMNVSEYRISRVFRDHFKARNFNQFINEMRIRHAKTLLQDPENTHWPVVVVGMESGFASVGPFTRAFKSNSGMTPNQYRQYHQTQSKNCRASLHG